MNLFDQIKNANSNIVKFYYNFKKLFYILYTPVFSVTRSYFSSNFFDK